ncbi:MAG TPA: chitobiase/beta-hexosaminidase C-terminal domain-containing protein, partial [Clostridia bacterium]|nr:chitobiase/beta-hexosaminidase C-terminal domain-containing protein [Clostridia bacterium]
MLRYKWCGKAFVIFCIFLVFFIGIKNNIFADSIKRILSARDCGVVINEVMAANRNYLQDDDGNYSDYLELYNKSDNPVTLKGFGLTNDPDKPFLWRFPNVIIEPKSFLVVWISGKDKHSGGELHTNFLLRKNDNSLVITEPSGTWKTAFLLYDMHDNISTGRQPDGSGNIEWFDGGTAGAPNTLEPLQRGCASKRLPAVSFSVEGGFYEKSLLVALSHEDSEAQIYYTLDGSVPTKSSTLYNEPIKIIPRANAAVVIRARAFKDGYPSSFTVTRSYFVHGG